MIHHVDERLRTEARLYRFAFACPDCVQFDPDVACCSLGFPNEPHRDPGLDGREEVIFCKAFELW
jgi:hypothetical protein